MRDNPYKDLPPQEVQGRYDTEFFRAGKMCGMRLVAVLRGEPAEQ